MANQQADGKKRSYIESKKAKKKSASNAAWILVLLALIFVFVLVKFAKNAGMDFLSTGLPSGDDAYSVAKSFIRSDVRAEDINFPDSGYQMGKRSDSVYVVRTKVELKGSGDKRLANYKLLMQYKGGKQDDTKNWLLLNISEQ